MLPPGDAEVEFIGAAPVEPKPRSGRTVARSAIVATIICCIGLLYAVSEPGPRSGRLFQPIDPHIGDPFAVDWESLPPLSEGAVGYERPLPMAGTSPICVGFGRIDWPVEVRHPTVAYCFADETSNQLPHEGATILTTLKAGADTWYVILFGREVTDVELGFESTVVPRERMYVGGPFAAILAPANQEPEELRWRVTSGAKYATSLRPRQDSNLQSTG